MTARHPADPNDPYPDPPAGDLPRPAWVEPQSPMRHCFNCGAEMGRYRDYRRDDTCGELECDRELRNQYAAEREEAHERLDRDIGWDR
jgi:hypothetical protein